MMYMMSAGKAEISRLNNSMDETAKLVKELKAELSRRKTLHNRYSSNLRTEVETNQINCRGMLAYATATTSCSEKADAGKVIDSLVAEEGECSSSVLTEEQPPDLSEMDHLEAEFESELQKLPWCFTEGSRLNERADTSEVVCFFYISIPFSVDMTVAFVQSLLHPLPLNIITKAIVKDRLVLPFKLWYI